MQVGVTGFKFKATPGSCQTITKRLLIFTDYLSFAQYLIKPKSHTFWLDEDADELQRKHTALSVIGLTESSVLAETIIGMIFCPCMDCIFWWKLEIEFRELMYHVGLTDVFPLTWLHLHHFYWLRADKCWRIVCAVWPHRSQTAWMQAQSGKLWPWFSAMAKFSLKLLVLWWFFSDVQQPSRCRHALPFTGKEMRVLSELLAKTGDLTL